MARNKHNNPSFRFLNYPIPEQGPETPYHPTQEQNPVLRGWPLVLASQLVSRSSLVAGLIWSNAKFGTVRDIPGLGRYTPRLDPTVVPIVLDNGNNNNHNNEDGGGGIAVEETGGTATLLETLLTPDLYEQKQKQRQQIQGRFHSAADYHEAYKSGEVTPVDVAEFLLSILSSSKQGHDLAVANSLVDREKVMAYAQRSAARYSRGESLGLLDGVPVGVKEDLDVEGYVSYNGLLPSAVMAAAGAGIPPEAAKTTIPPVSRLEAAGCIVLCKTAMHELGTDTSGCNPRNGTPLNYFAPGQYYPGGSSSGSGSALGAGLLVIAVGTDAGGSLRIPAAYNGVFALKPTLHRTMVMRSSICVVGPMAANSGDLTAAYRVMSEPDLLSEEEREKLGVQGDFAPPSSSILPSSSSSSSLNSSDKETRKEEKAGRRKILGICKPWVDVSSPEVKTAFYRAVEYFREELGYEVADDISIPYLSEGQYAHSAWALTEAADQQRSSPLLSCPLSSSSSPSSDPGLGLTATNHPNRVLLSLGSLTPGTDMIKYSQLRELLMRHLSFLFQKYREADFFILTPTSPDKGWAIHPGDEAYGFSDANMTIRQMMYIWLASSTGCPSVSAPMGYVAETTNSSSSSEGGKKGGRLPLGFMATGEWGGEEALLRWARDAEVYLDDVTSSSTSSSGRDDEEEKWEWRGGRIRPQEPGWVDVLRGAKGKGEGEEV